MNGETYPENPAISAPDGRRSLFATFANLPIGLKLSIGFGILVFLTSIGAVVSSISSYIATTQIGRTEDVRVPTTLLASSAQADLLRMQSDVRGYLALGDPAYLELYAKDSRAFEENLAKLERLSPELGPVSQVYLQQLRKNYTEFSILPEQLFELRDDQLDREPAYRLLATDGISYAGEILIAVGEMIEIQSQREPSIENMGILAGLAKFQGEFSAMLSALRGYVTTRNRIYRGEFQVNLDLNNNSWERLQESRSKLTSSQQEYLITIEHNRAAFLTLPDQIFTILEGDRWREDLYLFQTRAVPLSTDMHRQLEDIVADQQERLTNELASGRRSLVTANRLILASGIIAVLLGLLMGLLARATIAQPVRRLTNVVERIREGELDAQAKVESRDEIGMLASTFNRMTAQLRATLSQVSTEKKRVDDLLEVVIPIGVELTTERDYNRLLEKLLLEAKSYCKAAASLLLLTGDDETLRYSIVRIDMPRRSLGGSTGNTMPLSSLPLYDAEGQPNHSHLATYIALTGETVNIPDLAIAREDFAQYIKSFHLDRALADYEIHSLLGIPLKSVEFGIEERVHGVLLLMNAQNLEQGNIIPFDPNMQQMMESLSSLAVAAIEIHNRETSLRAEVDQLRIEIDTAAKKIAVDEIVNTDFFRDLLARLIKTA